MTMTSDKQLVRPHHRPNLHRHDSLFPIATVQIAWLGRQCGRLGKNAMTVK